jgi:hypothetical protein
MQGGNRGHIGFIGDATTKFRYLQKWDERLNEGAGV